MSVIVTFAHMQIETWDWCAVLTLCKQLGDRFTVVLSVITLFSSKLLIGCLHALFERTEL